LTTGGGEGSAPSWDRGRGSTLVVVVIVLLAAAVATVAVEVDNARVGECSDVDDREDDLCTEKEEK